MTRAVQKLTSAALLRAGSVVVYLAVLLFAALMLVATSLYPGGSYFDATSQGYDWQHNFWCDLLHDVALGGAPNSVAARYAQAAFWALGLGLIPVFLTLAAFADGQRWLRTTVAGLGVFGVMGMLGVALLPSNRFPTLHGLLVTSAGPAAILAACLGLYAGFWYRWLPRHVLLLGALTLLLGTLNALQYAREFYLAVPAAPWLPGVQKLATLALIAWMLAVARFAQRFRGLLAASLAPAQRSPTERLSARSSRLHRKAPWS